MRGVSSSRGQPKKYNWAARRKKQAHFANTVITDDAFCGLVALLVVQESAKAVGTRWRLQPVKVARKAARIEKLLRTGLRERSNIAARHAPRECRCLGPTRQRTVAHNGSEAPMRSAVLERLSIPSSGRCMQGLRSCVRSCLGHARPPRQSLISEGNLCGKYTKESVPTMGSLYLDWGPWAASEWYILYPKVRALRCEESPSAWSSPLSAKCRPSLGLYPSHW